MPLEPGASRKVVGQNIREMRESGHPQKQAVAASLRNARETGGSAGAKFRKMTPGRMEALKRRMGKRG